MKKIYLALAAGSIVLAAPAVAETVAGPFKNHGDCQVAVSWARYDARKGIADSLNDPGVELTCAQINGLWYIVTA